MPRRSELAPYHVQLRMLERRMVGSTLLQTNWDFKLAAEALGVGERYLRARVIQLGGILPDTECNEPPPAIWAKRPRRSKDST